MELGPLATATARSNLFSLFPIRYAARTCCCGCSCAHVDSAARRGAPLLAVRARRARRDQQPRVRRCRRSRATLVALAVDARRPLARGALGAARARSARRRAASRVALVALLTLARRRLAAALRHAARRSRASSASSASALLPMPSLGFHLVVYATFAAALVRRDGARARGAASDRALTGAARVVRRLRARRRRLLRRPLAPAGADRPLLRLVARAVAAGVVVVRAIAARGRRAGRSSPSCRARRLRRRWSARSRRRRRRGRSSTARRRRRRAPRRRQRSARRVRREDDAPRRARRDAARRSGHRIAERHRVDDVTPYANVGSMMTRAAVARAIGGAAARRRRQASSSRRKRCSAECVSVAGSGAASGRTRCESARAHRLHQGNAGAPRRRRSAAVSAPLSRSIALDRRRVDAAQHREVERDEVAEQHERDEPLDARLAAALDAERGGGARADQAARQLDPLADARMQVGVVEEDGAEAARARPRPPSRRSRCGRARAARAENAGIFAFSLSCVFQR